MDHLSGLQCFIPPASRTPSLTLLLSSLVALSSVSEALVQGLPQGPTLGQEVVHKECLGGR